MESTTNNNNNTDTTTPNQNGEQQQQHHQPTRSRTFRYKIERDIHALPDVNTWPNRPIYLQADEDNTRLLLSSSSTTTNHDVDIDADTDTATDTGTDTDTDTDTDMATSMDTSMATDMAVCIESPRPPSSSSSPPTTPPPPPLPPDKNCLPLGIPIDFESDLFIGKVLMRVRNVTSNVSDSHTSYFHGRRRLKQFIVQGRFKESESESESNSSSSSSSSSPIKMSEVHFGDVYGKPLKMSSVVQYATPLLQRVIPGVIMDLISDAPRIMVLMAGEAKTFNVHTPGMEPDICDLHLMEDSTLLGFESTSERKKILGNPHTACHYIYDPNLIYTMEFYDDVIDVEAYSVKLPLVGNYFLGPFLDMQPFTFAALTTDHRYLFNFRIYHELLVQYKADADTNTDADDAMCTSMTEKDDNVEGSGDGWEDNDNNAVIDS